MNYTESDDAEHPIDGCDDANIPVCCFIMEPDEDSPKWRWTASNFMPRKEVVTQSLYYIEADAKEALIEAVNKFVVPLYEAALKSLKETGACYYWREPKDKP